MDFNNISFLSKLTSIIQVAAIILVFLAGILQASRFYLDSKIRSLTRPRQIPKNAISILRTELSKDQGESIEITCPLEDQEANNFAEDLKKLFESSGWNVNGVNLAIYKKPFKGLIIVIKEKSYESKAQNIINLLKNAGFHCIGERDEEAGYNLGIAVGNKE